MIVTNGGKPTLVRNETGRVPGIGYRTKGFFFFSVGVWGCLGKTKGVASRFFPEICIVSIVDGTIQVVMGGCICGFQ